MTRTNITLLALTAMGSLLSACDGGGNTGVGGGGGSGGGGTPTSSSSVSVSASTSASTSTSTSTSGGNTVTPELKVLVDFKGADKELPEGVAVTKDGKTAYVGFAPTGKIVKIALPEGTRTEFGGLAIPPANSGILLGLVLDASGNLFAGVSGLPKAGAGVYQIDTTTGAATLVIEDSKITFPNGFVFADDGSLFFTDSKAGSVFKADLAKKQVQEWATDPLLAGVPAPGNKCAEGLPPDPTGANGIALIGKDVYVANVQNATLIKIPAKADGSADQAVVFSKADASCAPLQGIDGIAADKDGSILYVGNTGNTLGRITADGKATPILAKDPKFDFPASISIATVNGARYAIITNFAVATAAKPGLLSYGPLP